MKCIQKNIWTSKCCIPWEQGEVVSGMEAPRTPAAGTVLANTVGTFTNLTKQKLLSRKQSPESDKVQVQGLAQPLPRV